jgi:hypothetical protein
MAVPESPGNYDFGDHVEGNRKTLFTLRRREALAGVKKYYKV